MFEERPGQNMIEKEVNNEESLICTKVVCYCGIIILCGRSMFVDFVDHPYPQMYVQNVYQKNEPSLCILMQLTSYSRNDVPTNQQKFDNLWTFNMKIKIILQQLIVHRIVLIMLSKFYHNFALEEIMVQDFNIITMIWHLFF